MNQLIRINGKKLNILSTLVSVLDKEINLNKVDSLALIGINNNSSFFCTEFSLVFVAARRVLWFENGRKPLKSAEFAECARNICQIAG